MENLISRYRNVTILVVVLFAQVLGLAMQVDGELTATEVGMARCAGEVPANSFHRRRRVKVRQLPF